MRVGKPKIQYWIEKNEPHGEYWDGPFRLLRRAREVLQTRYPSESGRQRFYIVREIMERLENE